MFFTIVSILAIEYVTFVKNVNMIERILLLMKEHNLTASQFADMIGIQRSGMSHLISGRNKPSLEFVMKVLQRFPHVTPEWLLYGKGSPDRAAPTGVVEQVKLPVPAGNTAATLFDDAFANEPLTPSTSAEKVMVEPEPSGKPLKEPAGKARQVIGDKPAEERGQLPFKDMKRQNNSLPVEKIVIFYADRTFREYLPEG